jgi:hypothetical protein
MSNEKDKRSWRQWGLRKQLLVFLGSWTSVMLTFVLVVVVAVMVSLVVQGKQHAEDAVLKEVQNNMVSRADAISSLLDQTFYRYEKSLRTFQNAYEMLLDTSKTLPFQARTNYVDFNDTVLPGLTYDARCNCTQSVAASVYYVPESNNYNLQSLLSLTMKDNIERTQHIDSFLVPLYATNPEYLLLLFGMSNGGVYRRFPGKNVDETRAYDPRQRPWYTVSLQSPDQLNWAGPFLDAFGKGQVISCSRTVRRPNSGAIEGVASLNILITAIQDVVASLQVPFGGSAMLVNKDSSVVAHEKFGRFNNKTTIFELEPLSSLQWNFIKQRSKGLMVISKNGADYILSYNLIRGSFYLLTLVKKSLVTESVTQVQHDISATQAQVIGVTVGVACGVVLLTLACVLLASLRISRPVNEVQQLADKIVMNAGGRESLFANVDVPKYNGKDAPEPKSSNEAQQLKHSFLKLISRLKQEEAERATVDPRPPNPYYGNLARQTWKPTWTPALLRPASVASAPTAPDDVHLSAAVPSTSILPPTY